MISVWHIFWIAPMCTLFGFMMCAALVAGGDDDE